MYSRVTVPWRRRAVPVTACLSLLSLFLLVAGSRLWLVAHYTTPLPYWDSWDAEGSLLIVPWLEGRLHFADLFAPHNEHRIALTRLLSLGLFEANQQWDAQLGPAVDAVFWAGVAVVLAGTMIRWCGMGFRWAILAATGVCFIAPFGWENTLWSIESQNYFLIALSMLAVWGMIGDRAGGWRWFIGSVGGTLACLSGASGLLAAAAILGMILMRWLRGRIDKGRDAITGAACLLIIAIAWKFHVVVPEHSVLVPAWPGGYFAACCRYLAWPLYRWPLAAAWNVLPLAALAMVYLRRSAAFSENRVQRRQVEILLAAGGWVLLQIAALAHARGGEGPIPSSRYTDTFAAGILINFFAALLLARVTGNRTMTILVALWMLVPLGGIVQESRSALDGPIPQFLAESRVGEQNLRGYVLTHDYKRFLANKPLHDLPYPFVQALADILDNSSLRPYLPPDVCEPLRIRADTSGGTTFVPQGFDPRAGELFMTQVWGSYGSNENLVATWHGRLDSPSRRPYLRFRFAGDLAEPGLTFVLRDRDSNERMDWKTTKSSGMNWHGDDIRKPGAHMIIEASDRTSKHWFAFNEPVEVGWLSRWTGFLLRRAGIAFITGAFLVVVAITLDFSRYQQSRE